MCYRLHTFFCLRCSPFCFTDEFSIFRVKRDETCNILLKGSLKHSQQLDASLRTLSLSGLLSKSAVFKEVFVLKLDPQLELLFIVLYWFSIKPILYIKQFKHVYFDCNVPFLHQLCLFPNYYWQQLKLHGGHTMFGFNLCCIIHTPTSSFIQWFKLSSSATYSPCWGTARSATLWQSRCL